MCLSEKFECMPVEELKKLQLKYLKEVTAWVYERVPAYKKKFDEKGVLPADIKSLDDIVKLPFTIKNDLRDNYPFGFLAVPMNEVFRIHASSGTTGKSTTTAYTANDMRQWGECVARTIYAPGIRPGDMVQIAFGFGLFTGGLGFQIGSEHLGCTVVPSGAGMTERQITLMKDFKVDGIFCTPSYALTIAEKADEMGVDLRKLPVKASVCGAEPFTVAMRKEIEDRFGIKCGETYGLTELSGPGAGFSCELQDGVHINEDHYIVEIVDPETLEPVAEGQKGEVVLTSLQRRAMPMIRYRTRDISRFYKEKCACGRTTARIEKVYGRSDDMLIISGVNVFPSQVESLLLDIDEIAPLYVLVVSKKGHLDKLGVKFELKSEMYASGTEKLKEIAAKAKSHIHSNIGINVDVEIVEPGTIARSEGKAVRIIDQR